MDSVALKEWLNKNNLILVKMSDIVTDRVIDDLCKEDIDEVSESFDDFEVEVEGMEENYTVTVNGDSDMYHALEFTCSCHVAKSIGVCHHIEGVRLFYLYNKRFPLYSNLSVNKTKAMFELCLDYEISDRDFMSFPHSVRIHNINKALYLYRLIVFKGYSVAQIKKYFKLTIPSGKLFYAVAEKVRGNDEVRHGTLR